MHLILQEITRSETRHKLSVHVMSTAIDDESNKEEEEIPKLNDKITKFNDVSVNGEVEKINDIVSFKLSQCLYPPLEPYMHEFPRKGIYSSKL